MTFLSSRLDPLFQMLHYARPHDSKVERLFAKKFIDPLPGIKRDRFGNRYCRIGKAPIIYSCHIDTIHHKPGTQQIEHFSGFIKLLEPNSCLGADDTAGIFIMREMLLARIPGLYIFHRAEEIGGLGSQYIATKTSFLKDIKIALAFDRAGTTDIITHQLSGRTASDAFAESLSQMLNLGHVPDPTGIFTDTANYEAIVPECSNISVGYDHAHSPSEHLDTEYLLELTNAFLTRFDPASLVVARDLSLDEPSSLWPYEREPSLERTIAEHPDAIADLLYEYGVDEDEIYQYIYQRTGRIPL